MSGESIFGAIMLTLFLVVLAGGGFLANKSMDNDMIIHHIGRGANFYQAYCAVHEPRTFIKCVDKISSSE